MSGDPEDPLTSWIDSVKHRARESLARNREAAEKEERELEQQRIAREKEMADRSAQINSPAFEQLGKVLGDTNNGHQQTMFMSSPRQNLTGALQRERETEATEMTVAVEGSPEPFTFSVTDNGHADEYTEDEDEIREEDMEEEMHAHLQRMRDHQVHRYEEHTQFQPLSSNQMTMIVS